MISLKEIGALCGVSESTVSKALKDHPAVSAATKEKVKAVARKHHYQPNANVQGIQSGRSQCIGVAINNFGDPYSGAILSAAQEILHDSGYDLIVIPWDLMVGRNEGIFDRFACRRADGVLLFPTSKVPDAKTISQLKGLDSPVIQIDQSWDGEEFGYVGSDNHSGGRDAIRLLLRGGCSQIGIIGYPGVSSGTERLAGALNELANRKVEINPKHILELSSEKEDDEESCRLLGEYFSSCDKPDGIFCFNDRIGVLAIKVAKKHGLSIPDELQVVGFGNLPVSFLNAPSLTTFEQQPHLIGKTAGQMLLDCINQKNNVSGKRVEIAVKAVRRESTSISVAEK